MNAFCYINTFMKRRFFQIIQLLKEDPEIPQRKIAKQLKISLAYVNKILFDMEQEKLLSTDGLPVFGKKILSDLALQKFEECRVDNAIIMAAGFGSRFVPLTYAIPKGLLEVFGERMIERQIKQLQEVGINDITLVVGYLKEAFEYLTDTYGVKLVYNPDFKVKNNLSTLYHVKDKLKNTYILSSDNWMRENIYHSHEYDSWYSAVKVEGSTKEWILKTGLHDKITDVRIGGKGGWVMYGPAYFSREFSKKIVPLIDEAYKRNDSDDWYWEDVYIQNIKDLRMFANRQPEKQVYEFESLDEIRRFDSSYLIASHNEWIELISKVFNCGEHAISNFKPLRFGMTNKSFLFQINGENYIFRIPGEGTELLINRQEEYNVYKIIEDLKISDRVIYLDPKSGVKITKFIEGAHTVDANNEDDLRISMKAARILHSCNKKVLHEFNFRERINYYEKISKSRNGILYHDYDEVRTRMDELLTLLDEMEKPYALSHIDLVPDNILIKEDKFYILDWEYAGMCDPLADIAMFALYAYYDEAMLEKAMYFYFERDALKDERIRIYSYVALGGFLWTLWTCYKQSLGVSFGDYGLKMYRYAKDYYKKVMELKQEI